MIYGLIDPRSRLIRYVGLSSSGLHRPRKHRTQSCPNTYCRHWVKALQRLGLDYEITVLEAVRTAAELAEAERWWIKFGKACGWPLTNLTDGGGLSEVTVLEKQRKRTAWEAAETKLLRASFSQEEIESSNRGRRWLYGIPAEIERQCFICFSTSTVYNNDQARIDEAIRKVRVTLQTAKQCYSRWLIACDPVKVRKKGVHYFRILKNSRERFVCACGHEELFNDHESMVRAVDNLTTHIKIMLTRRDRGD